jgi:hypothetical protein
MLPVAGEMIGRICGGGGRFTERPFSDPPDRPPASTALDLWHTGHARGSSVMNNMESKGDGSNDIPDDVTECDRFSAKVWSQR